MEDWLRKELVFCDCDEDASLRTVAAAISIWWTVSSVLGRSGRTVLSSISWR